jgi:hypothetical protein
LRVRSRDRQKPPTGEGAGEDGDEVLGGEADERKSVETNKQTNKQHALKSLHLQFDGARTKKTT